MNVWCHATCRPYTFLIKRKSSPNIGGVCIVGGKVTLIPIVSSNDMTYANVVSVPVEEHNRYVAYITTYPPSGAHVFNAAWTALHTLQERIHVLRKWETKWSVPWFDCDESLTWWGLNSNPRHSGSFTFILISCGESCLLISWCVGARCRGSGMVEQVGYSVNEWMRGRVTLCAVCTVHVETRSAGFLVEP
jgi:hypothetical protein